MCHNKIQNKGYGCSSYIYSSQPQLFRIHWIVDECPKFLFRMSKWKFCYSIIRRSTRFSEDLFWKTVKIKKNICFSWLFNVSQGLLANAKDYLSLAHSVSELIGFLSFIFYFEMDSNKHDTTLIILKLITETSEKETFFLFRNYIYDVNIWM